MRYRFLHPSGAAAYFRHMRLDILEHMEEARTHCISGESDSGSKDSSEHLLVVRVPLPSL